MYTRILNVVLNGNAFTKTQRTRFGERQNAIIITIIMIIIHEILSVFFFREPETGFAVLLLLY